MKKKNSMNVMMFGRAIFTTTGEEHRKLRKMMMPAFSTANLRGMMPHFYDVAERVCLNPAPCSF
jgi:cytochrome P450